MSLSSASLSSSSSVKTLDDESLLLDLSASLDEIRFLAQAVDFTTTCGHSSLTTATLRDQRIVCEDCYLLTQQEEMRRRRESAQICVGASCFQCEGTRNVRNNIDSGINLCDACYWEMFELDHRGNRSHLGGAAARVVPDEVSPNILYIGAKESASDREVLMERNITRVLVCGDFLPEYHHNQPGPPLLYHRIPIEDSLTQSVVAFIPSAMAFIAQGALKGEKTLVHCNAGVSRSGIMCCEWVRRTAPAVGRDLLTAHAQAKKRRRQIHPNSNFMRQAMEIADAERGLLAATAATADEVLGSGGVRTNAAAAVDLASDLLAGGRGGDVGGAAASDATPEGASPSSSSSSSSSFSSLPHPPPLASSKADPALFARDFPSV